MKQSLLVILLLGGCVTLTPPAEVCSDAGLTGDMHTLCVVQLQEMREAEERMQEAIIVQGILNGGAQQPHYPPPPPPYKPLPIPPVGRL